MFIKSPGRARNLRISCICPITHPGLGVSTEIGDGKTLVAESIEISVLDHVVIGEVWNQLDTQYQFWLNKKGGYYVAHYHNRNTIGNGWEVLIKAIISWLQVLQVDAVGYGGRVMAKGRIVLKHEQCPQDVALNKNKNGAYQPSADLWGGHIQRVYGTKESPYGKLVAMYGAEKAKKVAKALGHTVYQTVDQQTGEVRQKVVISQ